MEYYDVKPVLDLGAQYTLIWGERSNGKTTSPLLFAIEKYCTGQGRSVYVRQKDIQLVGHRGTNVMQSLRYGGEEKDENLIHGASGGAYDQVKYTKRSWFLGQTQDDDTILWDTEAFCFAMSLSLIANDKSATPPQAKFIVFDEFIPLGGRYLDDDEPAMLKQLVSTVFRGTPGQVVMLANAITWNSPYFKMFGATKKVRNMKQGEILVLELGKNTGMKVALQYVAPTEGGKKSDIMFDFADENSSMITNGMFAIPNYPKYTKPFNKSNVKCTYWFDMGDDEIIRSRLMKVGRDVFIFSDKPNIANYEFLRDDRRDLFYSLDFSAERNHYVSPLQRYADSRTHYLVDAFVAGRMFFSTNEVGEDLMYYAKVADDKTILSL